MRTFKQTLATSVLAVQLLLPAAVTRAQYGPQPSYNHSAAMMRQQAQMMNQATMQMQRMHADFMRQQQMFHHHMMINNMMHNQWQMRAHMLQVARSSYRSIMRVDSTPQADLEKPYLAEDFIQRAQQIHTFSVLPVETQSYLFSKQGYFVKALLDSALQRRVALYALDQITLALATKLRANQSPIKAVSVDKTCQKLEIIGFAKGVVADTTLRALFDCLGTDLLVLPRVTVFGVGTKHVNDALEAGITPDSSNRIQVESNTQGVFFSVEVVAFDRSSIDAEGPAIRALWRSQLFARAIVYKVPGAINLKPRANPEDYFLASSELATQLANVAPLRDAEIRKLVRVREKEEKKLRAKS